MNIEKYAAELEARQAAADYSEAFQAFVSSGSRMGSAEDYNVWSAAAYADTAERAGVFFIQMGGK